MVCVIINLFPLMDRNSNYHMVILVFLLVKNRQLTKMVDLSFFLFLLVLLCQFNLIEGYHSMQIKVCKILISNFVKLVLNNVYNCTPIPFQHANQNTDFDIKNSNSDQLNPLLIALNIKKFDILKLLSQSLLKGKETYENEPKSHWILDHQQKFLIEETKHAIGYKFRHKPKYVRPEFDQEINSHYQRTTRKPRIFNIFAPNNNNRFDNWGG